MIKGKGIAEKARREGKSAIESEVLDLITKKYQHIVLRAGNVYLDTTMAESPPEGAGKEGFNHFRHFLKKMNKSLYFIRDLEVLFSNNLAEQDL